jgi:hypothetical protein
LISARFSASSSAARRSHLYAQYPAYPNTPIAMKWPPGSGCHMLSVQSG